MRWLGALLFAASLVHFAYRYLVTYAQAVPGEPEIDAITWNVALFTIFAIHHTLFARTPLRDAIARRLPGLERSFYVWVASLLFILVCAAWQPIGGVVWDVNGPIRALLLALQVAGVLLTLRGAAVLDFRDLAGIRAGTAMEFRTTGPYGWVRHPIYLGWFLMVLPATPMTMTRLVFAAVSCVYLIAAIPFEEGTLRRTSDGAYDAYIARVKWRLLPGIY